MKEAGRRAGADLVGVADAAALTALAPDADPERFLRGARRVVVAIVADPPGIASAGDSLEYTMMAYPGYLKADGAARLMRGLIRSEGYAARGIVRDRLRARDRAGRMRKTLPLKQAAQAAGLGSVGLHSLLVTPGFGPRVRMAGFLTDAPLAADPPFESPLCDDCGLCLRECPSGAVGADHPLNLIACSSYLFAGVSFKEIRSAFEGGGLDGLRGSAERLAAAAAGWADSLREGRRLYYNCGRCMQVCNGHTRAKLTLQR